MQAGKYVTEAITDPDLREELERRLIATNGYALFPALFDLKGRLIPARLVMGLHGLQWAILASDNPQSKVLAWFTPSQAKSRHLRVRHDTRHGYYVGVIRTSARLGEIGTGILRRLAIVRADYGFCRDCEIVDNGTTEGDTSSPEKERRDTADR